jgi:hypothetical protein
MQELLLVRVKSIFLNFIEMATSDVSQLYSFFLLKVFPISHFPALKRSAAAGVLGNKE